MSSNRKRPCKICGVDLEQWGPDQRGSCPDCKRETRSAMIPCAGRCGRVYQMRFMDVANFVFTPGKKGGKKIKIYYCEECARVARARAVSIHDNQEKAFAKVKARLKNGAREGSQ